MFIRKKPAVQFHIEMHPDVSVQGQGMTSQMDTHLVFVRTAHLAPTVCVGVCRNHVRFLRIAIDQGRRVPCVASGVDLIFINLHAPECGVFLAIFQILSPGFPQQVCHLTAGKCSSVLAFDGFPVCLSRSEGISAKNITVVPTVTYRALWGYTHASRKKESGSLCVQFANIIPILQCGTRSICSTQTTQIHTI